MKNTACEKNMFWFQEKAQLKNVQYKILGHLSFYVLKNFSVIQQTF